MYIYESDVTKVGGNLQKTVAYLLSLHKAEYEWNMLGIKVVGTKEALPIPDGTYEYGDAYMIGNKIDGFNMWIYTRADEFHTEAYWFDIGQFPKPGPQGPAGPGLDDIASIDMSAPIENVTFDTTSGITISANGIITEAGGNDYDISTEYEVPLIPGKYINMDADHSNSKVQVAIDDEKLALDYIKIDKTKTGVPEYFEGKIIWDPVTSQNTPNTVVYRNSSNAAAISTIGVDRYTDTNYGAIVPHAQLYRTIMIPDNTIPSTTSDSGVLSVTDYNLVKDYQSTRIKYKSQIYYCMDPRDAPDGTLNFVHIDVVQSGGGYAARGKCFSITTSTRAWQVVDMSFGPRTHQLTITDNVTNAKVYMTLVSNQSTPYAADELITAMGERSFPCTLDSVQNDNIYSGVISALDNTFTVRYSNNQEFNVTDSQVTITDYVV